MFFTNLPFDMLGKVLAQRVENSVRKSVSPRTVRINKLSFMIPTFSFAPNARIYSTVNITQCYVIYLLSMIITILIFNCYFIIVTLAR